MAEKPNAPQSPPDQARWLGLAQVVLILAVIAVALYFARAPDRAQRDTVSALSPEATRPVVRVIQPAEADKSPTVELTGAVRLSERARIKPEVAGRVIWVSPKFKSGGTLAADETFVRIDPAEYALQVTAAEIAVRAAEAHVGIEKAEDAEAARAFAEANPAAEATARIDRAPFIARAEARLMKARTDLDLAKLRLERTNISLPYPSRVINSRIEVGEYVSPDLVGPSPFLGVVYRTQAVQVSAPIALEDMHYLHPVIGRSAQIRAQGRTYEAEVVRTSSVVAPQTRLATVFLRFAGDHAPESLPLPGAFAEISVEGPEHDAAYVLPEAVLQEQGRVWVVRDGALSAFTPRTLGRTDEGWVVDVFDAGEGVVVGTLPGAREGLAVAVADPASSE